MRISPAKLMTEFPKMAFFEAIFCRSLCEEALSAYKEIDKVMRAQKKLVKKVRKLRPILTYKGN